MQFSGLEPIRKLADAHLRNLLYKAEVLVL